MQPCVFNVCGVFVAAVLRLVCIQYRHLVGLHESLSVLPGSYQEHKTPSLAVSSTSTTTAHVAWAATPDVTPDRCSSTGRGLRGISAASIVSYNTSRRTTPQSLVSRRTMHGWCFRTRQVEDSQRYSIFIVAARGSGPIERPCLPGTTPISPSARAVRRIFGRPAPPVRTPLALEARLLAKPIPLPSSIPASSISSSLQVWRAFLCS